MIRSSSRYLVILVAVVAVSMLLMGVVGVGTQSAASARAQGQATSACVVDYGLAPLDSGPAQLSAVAFSAADDGWAVGSAPASTTSGALISYHWNGQSWQQVALSAAGQTASVAAITAIARDDAWAVGNYDTGADYPNVRTLTLHWDGRQWQQQLIPGLGNLGRLTGVAGVAGDDVWAVGSYYNPDRKVEQSIILHWDGAGWTPAQLPALASGFNHLTAVSARAANDVWAAGYYYNSSQYGGPQLTRLLFLHWDGSAWHDVAPPAPEQLTQPDIVATKPNSAWAVGFDWSAQNKVVLAHWDGVAWTTVASPEIADVVGFGKLALTASSDDDVWAVGSVFRTGIRTPQHELLVLHWDGHAWSELPVSNPVSTALVSGVALASAGNLWLTGAQGDVGNGQQAPLLLHLDARPCPTPTPVAVAPPLAPPVALPGTDSVTFPATGKTVRGLFLAYWNAHGGLAQQGYPISDVIGEVSPLDGKTYTVQYFERAVFEYHPENMPPYDVLLAQLDTFRYKQLHPYGAPNQRPNSDPGSIAVPQTGKRLGGAFYYYWLNHGGLMQQGYPVSEEFTEISPLDGKPYTVQYFERAVFEYHPENVGSSYEVLLSQLGRFQYDARYSAAPPATGSAAAPELIADHVYGPVAANDRYLFWIADDPPVYSVHGYDVQQHRAFLITDRPAPKSAIAADAQTVAWIEGDVARQAGIKGYDIAGQSEITLVEDRGPGQLRADRLALAGDMLYYVASAQGSFGIVAHNNKSGQEQLLIVQGQGPAIAGGALVYSRSGDCAPAPCVPSPSLYLHQSDRADDILLAGVSAAENFRQYNISGANIVWTNPGSGPATGTVFFYQIDSNIGQWTTLPTTNADYPVVNDKLVVWAAPQTAGGANWSLSAYDIAADKIVDLLKFQSSGYVAPQALIGNKALAYTSGGSSTLPGGYLFLLDLAGNP